MHWYAGLGNPPALWFAATPESAPTKFDCNLTGNDRLISVIAPQQRVELSCQQQAASQDQRTQPPELNALSRRDSWTLHSPMIGSDFVTAEKLDVAIESFESQQQANGLIARSSCRDRGSCEVESSMRRTERNAALGPLAYWPVGIGAFLIGAIVFFIVRFATGMSAARTAGVLSLLLAAVMIAATVYLGSFLKGHHDGFAAMGVAFIWFGLLIVVAFALAGIWVARFVIGQPGSSTGSSETEPQGR